MLVGLNGVVVNLLPLEAVSEGEESLGVVRVEFHGLGEIREGRVDAGALS